MLVLLVLVVFPILNANKKVNGMKLNKLTPYFTCVTMPTKLEFYSLILYVTILNLYRHIGGGRYSASTLLLERLTFVELKCSGIFQLRSSLKVQR